MRNSTVLAILVLAVVPLCVGASADIPQSAIETAYDELTPAICLVTHSWEITNPKTGATSKRANSVLGLVVSGDGLVMAPGHMKRENAEPFNIRVSVGQGEDERKYDATLLEKPDDINVCFLRIESEEPLDLPHLRFKRGAQLKLGEPVMLIGILSESLDFNRGTFLCRIGSILDKPRTTYCLDTSIRYGFVGGPVINVAGEAVGVVGFDLTPAEGGDLYIRSGHPLVYQSDLFQKYIDRPPGERAATEDKEDSWLGVFTQPLTDDLAEYWGLEQNGGVVVSTLVAGSPAEAAGLQRGDVIAYFDDVRIKAKQDHEVLGFTKLVRETGVGKDVAIRLLRNGEPAEVHVTLAARPKSAQDAGEFEDRVFGLTVREITTDVRILLNLAESVQGVIVRRVKSGSAANLAGIRSGVIIMNLGGYPIGNLDDFQQAVEKLAADKPDEIAAFCRAGVATGFFRLRPRW